MNMTIELNLAYAIITILLGVSLVFSVIASIFAVRLLDRCKAVLDFVVFLGTKDSDTRLSEKIKEHSQIRAEAYNAGYSKGYTDGKIDGMKVFAEEHSELLEEELSHDNN